MRRSIPAGAGEPRKGEQKNDIHMVYPRGCGGTLSLYLKSFLYSGLSPRVRGNRRWAASCAESSGSIPAGAGEPSDSAHQPFNVRVYPRGCGGTILYRLQEIHDRGLSPRVRGNPVWFALLSTAHRSIPAGAGEPNFLLQSSGPPMVYPRGCGGTPIVAKRDGDLNGLSPRVRGNRPYRLCASPCKRSIPAGAGEPPLFLEAKRRLPVYPRGCGGTYCGKRQKRRGKGLSPRVRGNRLGFETPFDCSRSIPAGAGEPDIFCPSIYMLEVYPRGCGGTITVR